FAIVFDANLLLAAELDVNGEAARARIDRVFDELLDDRRRAFDDFPRGDLIREIRREADDFHIQRLRRKRPSIAAVTTRQMPTIHQNCAASPPGNRGNPTFMPYIPVSSVSGMKIVETTVSTFITSFRRLLVFERCASSMPVI